MRFLFALLGFLALVSAPLAAPAAPMATGNAKCEAGSTMIHGQEHKGGDHQGGPHATCCMMAPATLPPAAAAGDGSMTRLANVAPVAPALTGIVLDGDDPPPRAV